MRERVRPQPLPQIPRYDVLEVLSRTPAFLLCRARRAATGQTCLIRVSRHDSRVDTAREDVSRELAWLGGLSLPGLARGLEAGEEGGTAWLVLADDGGLSPLSTGVAGPPRQVGDALAWGVLLSETLAELHQRDWLLNLLQPASILIDRAGERLEICDASLVRRPPVDGHALAAAIVSAGGAAYMAPEQTGRVNRTIDHRADLYALGAVLYEALTGQPPFVTSDTLELLHAHIARTPVPPSAIHTAVPEAVSEVVLRLLAKGAEDRYQSARGVGHDLDRCRRDWLARGSIATFALGARDASHRLLIPQRLYGRDLEVDVLTRAFAEALGGQPRFLLVSGASGVGKTAFVTELCRPIARERGYFITGKFDQVTRDIPYGAVIQAFRGLVRQILTEREDRLAEWRRRLATALGANGGVVSEVIPEVELLIGRQLLPQRLDAAELRNRFRYAFQAFVDTFAGTHGPLVMFLDDLQWADAASLELVEGLASGADRQALLMIGAYRETEVGPAHPLRSMLARLEARTDIVRRLSISALDIDSLTAWLAETLKSSPETVTGLARLIYERTGGNPFFATQLLHLLHQERLLWFNHASGRWTFLLADIAARGMTDDVVALMTERIRQLSPTAQTALRLGACIGNPFSRATFATVAALDPVEAEAGLREALDAGLIRPTGESFTGRTAPTESGAFAFLHDRAQQASYALIPDAERAETHLAIGRRLLDAYGRDVLDDRLFEIVTHLNAGRSLVSDREEQRAFARLNLAAGRKARLSAAHSTALGYFEAGVEFCGEASWTTEYALVFALHLGLGECRYLAGQFAAAEAALTALLARASTDVDRASIHGLRVSLHENRAAYAQAVGSARDGLALLGVALPTDDDAIDRALQVELDAIATLLAGRPIRTLLDLPVMVDPGIRMAMQLLTLMWAPTYISGHRRLTSLISATQVRLSLEHGNVEDSAYGYVTHAITIGPVMRDYQAAYEWGELALAVNEQFDDRKYRAKVHQQFHAHVKLWCRPFATCVMHAREAWRSGLEAGDFAYAGYGAATETWPAFLSGGDLDRFVSDYTPTAAFLEKINVESFRDVVRTMINWALALQGRTVDRCSLTGGNFDEDDFIARYTSSAPLLVSILYTAKLHLALIHGEPAKALEAARRAEGITIAGTMWPVLEACWGALAAAAAFDDADPTARATLRQRVASATTPLDELAVHCPENFRVFSKLVTAELARIDGEAERAARVCEEAAAYARLIDHEPQHALASELAARAWLAHGDSARAADWLARAYRSYAAWGASAKLHQMHERYGDLLAARPGVTAHEVRFEGRAPVGTLAASLDAGAVLKIAHAIAAEIEVDALLPKLLTIALGHAGAAYGLFILTGDDAETAEVEAFTGPDRISVGKPGPWPDAPALAQRVVRYVRRTGQDIVIGDVTQDERFAGAGASATRVRSVMCVPVSRQGQLQGIVYLEHGLTDAFTQDRLHLLRVVSAQAAIALENARLFERMKEEVARRTAAEGAARDAIAELETLKDQLLAENVYLQEEIGAQHSFNEIIGRSPALVEALRKVERVAPTDSTVLIVGETGSGKELFARAIHTRSARRQRPLVKVNCGAIPPGLVESELFGHLKGAFTGAVEKRIGRFELASGGTIFLDEVGELPLDTQVKLLRVLQEQEFEPVGSSRTVRVDVRVIAATNRDLDVAVREGRFRADLLYRLNVFPVAVPPLRQRPSDVPLLAEFFLAGLSRKLGKPIQGFTARSLETLRRYGWPGNVRELQNVVERTAILAAGPVLDLPPGFFDSSDGQPPASDAGTITDVQRTHILHVLARTNGVVEGDSGAAAILGMHPNTLRSRMKKLGIRPARRPATDRTSDRDA